MILFIFAKLMSPMVSHSVYLKFFEFVSHFSTLNIFVRFNEKCAALEITSLKAAV